ncbi:14253_t:CDS:1, partial [Entrophospora sp. SA101]
KKAKKSNEKRKNKVFPETFSEATISFEENFYQLLLLCIERNF